MRWAEPLRRWMLSNYRRSHLSPLAVPFALAWHLDERATLVERGTKDVRGLIICGLFIMLIAMLSATVLAVGGITRADGAEYWIAIGAVPAGLLFGLAVLLLAGMLASTEIHIRPSRDGRGIEIVDVLAKDDEVLAEGPIEEFSITVRPVIIEEKPVRTWRGFALILSHNDAASIALACQRSMEEIEQWRQSAPAWVRAMPLQFGTEWRRMGTTRL